MIRGSLIAPLMWVCACSSSSDRRTDPPPVGEIVPDVGGVLAPRDRSGVFFIGHSQVNHHMPEMLQDIARGLGRDHTYDIQVKNGASLRQHWEETDPGEGRACDGQDGRPRTCNRLPGSAVTALPSGGFDTVVIVERVPIGTTVQYECTYAYALEFYNLAIRSNPATQVYYYETWQSTTMTPDWPAQISSDREIIDRLIVDSVNTPPEAPVVSDPSRPSRCPHVNPPRTRESGPLMRVIPAGSALAALDREIASGTVPNVTSREQLFADHIHLNDLGNYFIALVMYATIYRRDPAGAPTKTSGEWMRQFEEPAEDTARRFQEIAWAAVRSDPRAGVD